MYVEVEMSVRTFKRSCQAGSWINESGVQEIVWSEDINLGVIGA